MSVMDTSNLTIEMLKKMFSVGKRFDGRSLNDFRDFKISYEVSNKAEGSARIMIGKTEVVVGVKMSVGTPYPDSKDKGNLMVSGDLLPLASPRFESGPPGFTAIELPRLIDRAIRESGMIDLKSLVISEDKVWNLIIDIYPINDDGNIIDAAGLACVAALKNTKIPVLDSEGMIDYSKESKAPLSLSKETAPISFSFFKLGTNIILDPTREEEEACDARITFGISKWNGQYMINSCQKNGKTPLTQEEINMMMKLLPQKYEEINEKLKKQL